MKMEHINENTIRVLLGSDDLSARGITVLDLLGNHKQIQDFFYSILDEVDTDHEFRDNDSVTFQVLPTRTGLELFISKADPNDAEASGNSNNAAISKYIKREMTAKDQPVNDQEMMNFTHRAGEGSSLASQEPIANQTQLTRVAKFDDFEDLLQATSQLETPDSVASDLYQMDGHYYLVLTFFNDGSLSTDAVDDVMAVISEYTDSSAVTEDLLGEHGKLLMQHAALERLKYYFN